MARAVQLARGHVPTLESYDALPYGSVPVAESHIERLAATAALMGMVAPDTLRPRVLELGCAEGGNLIPMAFDLAGGEFVGVDLSAQQVDAGQKLIGQLGLTNIRLEQRDIAGGLDDLGDFDFIIAHGLYSWVPQAVRVKILDVCGRQLRRGGIAYISFNVLPGWHMRGVLRNFLRSRVSGALTPAAQVEQALALLRTMLPAWQARASHEARLLVSETEHLLGVSASYLYHEYLTDINEPCLFADFVTAAHAAGLKYVADTDLTAMLPDAAAAAALAAVDGMDDRVQREQFLDYLAIRKFRRALLTRIDTEVADWPQAQAIRDLAFHADLTCDEELDFGSDTPQRFVLRDGGGNSVTIAHPLAKAAAMVLASACPSRIDCADLLAEAQALVSEYGTAQWADDVAGFEWAWIELWAQQAIQPATVARQFPDQPGAKPRAHALAQAQAMSGIVATARHGALRLDAAGCALLRSCDGSREIAAHGAIGHALQVFLRAGLLVDG